LIAAALALQVNYLGVEESSKLISDSQMPWSCPVCQRPFKHKNQMHSCIRVEVGEHLAGKNPHVVAIFQGLQAGMKRFGEVRVSSVKNCILFKSASTFLALKPKKEWVDIEFLLDQEIDEFPVHKTVRVSKNRVAHFVRLEHPREINRQLMRWLRRSFEITS
jgi:hypothetical protein